MSISNECGKSTFGNSPSGLRLSEAFAKSESNRSVRNCGIAVSSVGAIFRSISSGALTWHCFNLIQLVIVALLLLGWGG